MIGAGVVLGLVLVGCSVALWKLGGAAALLGAWAGALIGTVLGIMLVEGLL